MKNPRVTIIVPVKNAKNHLKETLESICRQDYQPLEIIVIDGGSTDGSLDVIQDFSEKISFWISESDKGISDAFNKGLKYATGEYINFQGAGDLLFSEDCISKLFKDIHNAILLCGKVMRVKEDGHTPLWIAPKKITRFKPSQFLFKMSLPHQGLFTHKSFFEKYGDFDVNVRFAMDYEILLRAYHDFPKTLVKDIIISRWREGGIGSKRIFEVFDEYHQIKIKHRINPLFILLIIDKFIRLKFYIKAKFLRLSY